MDGVSSTPDPAPPYLVPPAHQPGLGAGLAEEVNQRHDESLALGWHTEKVGLAQSLGQWFGGWRGAAGEEGTRSKGSLGGAWASPAGLGAPFPSGLPAAALVTSSANPWS